MVPEVTRLWGPVFSLLVPLKSGVTVGKVPRAGPGLQVCGSSGFASCSTAFTWVLGDGPAGVPQPLLAFHGSQLGLPRGWAPHEGPAQGGPPTHLHVVTGSNSPMGPAAPLVALNHMPWAPFVSVSFAQV